MSVSRFAKKELLAMGAGSATRASVGPIPGMINLGAGDPDFNQPEFIDKAVYDAMKAGHTHYEFAGVPEFKKAIADYYAKYGVKIDPNTQICIESGGSQAIFRSFGSILNSGDEILLMDPAYQGYTQPAAYFGAKMVKAPMTKDKNGLFRPNMENIRKAVSPKTKALLICNPDNPCGIVYTDKELKQIAELAVEKDFVVLSDEIYTEFVWKNKFIPIIKYPGMEERTMALMSFSKTFAWTGCRAGYIIAGPELSKIVNGVPIGIIGMPVPFQYAAAKALKEGWDFVDTMRKEYKKRIEWMVPRLNEIEGIKCPYPEGAFYLFPDISALKVPAMKFCADFFQQEKVRSAAGTQYGPTGEGHFRLALVASMKDLEDVCNRLERFVKKLK